jgi:hypothetical protein
MKMDPSPHKAENKDGLGAAPRKFAPTISRGDTKG